MSLDADLSMPVSGAAGPAAPQGLSQLARLIDGFIAPARTYADILRSTSWWLPFLLGAVVSLACSYTIDKKVGFDQVAQTALHQAPAREDQLQQLPPEQRTRQMQIMAASYRYISYGYPVMMLLFSALCALVLWGTVNFGLGASTTFSQILCLWMYTQLPRVFTGLLTIVSLLAGDIAESFNLQNPVGTNPGYYLSDAAPWLRSALSFADIIGLWTVFLLILGIAIVAKVSKGKAAAVVLGWWVIVLLLSVAGAVAGS